MIFDGSTGDNFTNPKRPIRGNGKRTDPTALRWASRRVSVGRVFFSDETINSDALSKKNSSTTSQKHINKSIKTYHASMHINN